MQAADAAANFDRLLDDTEPTLLDFLDSLGDGDASIEAGPDAQPVTSTKSKAKTKSNTWRQRQRVEVLRLREEVQQLDAGLKKLKLAAGVRSTVPLVASIAAAPHNNKRPAVRKLLHECR
ncbi:hypothetical protein PHYSODRAFT_339043 [Phytophthora sojae]|uniref:Uncharacterized protein n=1 Tax=Phytophthora sojae (strain P6497) TaxID=1094619 RepID=G5A5I2_PHYSP|nr:hypothetical protein PHYSODRAFT_339043 [Phytophthora sojae]EGZ08587.1 hypothetical protein PHYSODRAFT_339043 [Phytophthora sojae]|eukprot:XP_009535220.1 hypothetical protein PHYSODRAFT_339043 [Phytophthora sojae]